MRDIGLRYIIVHLFINSCSLVMGNKAALIGAFAQRQRVSRRAASAADAAAAPNAIGGIDGSAAFDGKFRVVGRFRISNPTSHSRNLAIIITLPVSQQSLATKRRARPKCSIRKLLGVAHSRTSPLHPRDVLLARDWYAPRKTVLNCCARTPQRQTNVARVRSQRCSALHPNQSQRDAKLSGAWRRHEQPAATST